MSLKRQRSPESVNSKSSQTAHHNISKSAKIQDRASIFIAYFSQTVAPRDLQSNPLLKSADHRMLAWRIPGSQRTLFAKSRALETGSDDDGENYAGKHILKVLDDMCVQGSVVVARWYGGVMLGPVRFTHIENVTRDAIRSWQQQAESDVQKRRKVEDEASEKATLVTDLNQRDQSIKVLRRLLDDAKMAVNGEPDPPKSSVSSAPAPAPAREIDYSNIPLEQLRRLDKARDGTIAFLLKRIDETEQQVASSTSVKPDTQDKDSTQQAKQDEKSPLEHSDPSTTTEGQLHQASHAD